MSISAEQDPKAIDRCICLPVADCASIRTSWLSAVSGWLVHHIQDSADGVSWGPVKKLGAVFITAGARGDFTQRVDLFRCRRYFRVSIEPGAGDWENGGASVTCLATLYPRGFGP